MGKHKSKHIVIPGYGDPCPRCGVPMQIREHDVVREKQLRQPFYYSRWFFCMEQACQTKQVMPPRYVVWNWTGEKRAQLEARLMPPPRERDGWDGDIVMETLNAIAAEDSSKRPDPADPNEPPPWE